MPNNKNFKYIIILVAVLAVAGSLVPLIYFAKQVEPATAPAAPAPAIDKQCAEHRKIDGICLAENDKDHGVFAAMIDNLPEARPQSGLSRASLVYEAIAEGNITRFLAVFSLNETVDKIGPIRSARPYYINFAREFACPYLHIGGSPAALDEISRSYKFDLNEMARGQYFWRDKTHYAPHNVYSSSVLVNQAIAKYQWDVKNNFDSFAYKDDALEAKRGAVSKIQLDFNSPDFLAEWRFDKEKNDYARWTGGKIHADADGVEVRAKNIIVIPSKYVTLDSYGRQRIDKVESGTGAAYIFRDGEVMAGKWLKANKDSRRKFFDNNDKEISFNAGTTWIEVLPVENKLTY